MAALPNEGLRTHRVEELQRELAQNDADEAVPTFHVEETAQEDHESPDEASSPVSPERSEKMTTAEAHCPVDVFEEEPPAGAVEGKPRRIVICCVPVVIR